MTKKQAFICMMVLALVGGFGIGLSISDRDLRLFLSGRREDDGGVYYDFTEPNILTHHHGRGEVTIYRKVEEKPFLLKEDEWKLKRLAEDLGKYGINYPHGKDPNG